MKKIILYTLCIIFGVFAFVLINKINGDIKMKNKEKNTTDVIQNQENQKNKVEYKEKIENNEENEEFNNEKNNTNISNNLNTDEVFKELNLVPTFKEENYERYIAYKNNNKNLANEEVIMRVNVKLDYNFYENINDSINKYTPLILVNKYYYIDENYVPNNLTEIDISCASNSNIYANSEAVNEFTNMCMDAKALGFTIKTISAYRSYEYQKKLYEGYLRNDSVASVDTYSARPGHSEHQTGYAFDVYNSNVDYTSFGDTNEFKWVQENANTYGFIIRYTSENSYITGYKNEPWHLRYVGKTAATYIYENNITLEEYLLNK